MSGGGEGETLEYTPTWVVAVVCTFIVAISLALERFLHFGGKHLKNKKQKSLFHALQKVKEELMLLGFISLLLTVFQNLISRICVPENLMKHMLPCPSKVEGKAGGHSPTEHYKNSFTAAALGASRRLLVETAAHETQGYCAKKGKVPFLSLEAAHHLHIFIFVLAIVHVIFTVLTVLIGEAKIRQWQHWEHSVSRDQYNSEKAMEKKITHVHQHDFIKGRFLGFGKNSVVIGWLFAFSKQFYASVTKSDYAVLRLGFIMRHCKTNPKFDFHKYMLRALQDDFPKVVGISWYLWIFVVVFLVLNINGLHAYFWLSFIPFILLLVVGTKLEHVITQLAQEVAEKHAAIEGDLVVRPSDEHFWFGSPGIVLYLIHFILFQNAFEIAFFFWILFQYGWDSCIMGQVQFIVPRLVMGAIIQVLCSYSTLPLYAIVTQMGSSFKRAIFDKEVQVGILGWADKAKRKAKGPNSSESSSQRLLHNLNNKRADKQELQLSSVPDSQPALSLK